MLIETFGIPYTVIRANQFHSRRVVLHAVEAGKLGVSYDTRKQA